MTVIARTADDIFEELESLQRSLGIAAAGRSALRGAAAGALVGAILLVLLHGQVLAFPAALALLVLGMAAGVALSLRSWPTLIQAARTADRRFDLENRVATAVELRPSQAPIACLQRNDLIAHLGDRRLAASLGRKLDRREIAAPLIALVLFLGAMFVGIPGISHNARAADTADAGRIHRVTSTRLPQVISRVNRGLTPDAQQSAALRKLNLALAQLQRKLRTTSTRAAALRSISATQAQLRQIASSLHPIKQPAVAQLNAALAARAGERANVGASSRAQIAQATRILQKLAASLKHASPSQRAALARALAQAASSSADAGLRSSLQRAASSLAYGDPQSASDALQGAAQSIAGTPNVSTAASRLSAAGNALDSLKSQLVSGSTGAEAPGAGSGSIGGGQSGDAGTGKGSGQGTGKGSGQGAGQGRGKGSRQGTGQGNGSGNGKGSGQGSGTGNGQGSGRGSGSGLGQGGSGGHGPGGGQGNAGGHKGGRYATVYVPVKQGKGTHTTGTGPAGQPGQVQLVPYQQVLARYLQSAHSSLDSRGVPPGRQGYVRQYFSAISQ